MAPIFVLFASYCWKRCRSFEYTCLNLAIALSRTMPFSRRILSSTLRRTRCERRSPFRPAQRPGDIQDPLSACRATIKGLARRWSRLGAEIAGYDEQLLRLTRRVCPELLARPGVGFEVASSLLVAAGDNPERLHSEASFAALCGVSPLDASSGQQRRHRLNRGGNRNANRALWVVAMTRLRVDTRTQEYSARRIQEGRTRPEILRCLKRYIARELYPILLRASNAEVT